MMQMYQIKYYRMKKQLEKRKRRKEKKREAKRGTLWERRVAMFTKHSHISHDDTYSTLTSEYPPLHDT